MNGTHPIAMLWIAGASSAIVSATRRKLTAASGDLLHVEVHDEQRVSSPPCVGMSGVVGGVLNP